MHSTHLVPGCCLGSISPVLFKTLWYVLLFPSLALGILFARQVTSFAHACIRTPLTIWSSSYPLTLAAVATSALSIAASCLGVLGPMDCRANGPYVDSPRIALKTPCSRARARGAPMP